MAKNITLLGANYPNVPAVQLPQTGGGTATFMDPDELTSRLVAKTGLTATVDSSDNTKLLISASNLGVSDCRNYAWAANVYNVWNAVINVEGVAKSSIRLRVWEFGSVSAATATLRTTALSNVTVIGIKK